MQVTVITCDNCQKEIGEKNVTIIEGHDVCRDCMNGQFVLDAEAISKWPRWVTTTAVAEAFRHHDRKIAQTRTQVKVSEVNKNLEAELLNLPLRDPTKLMREVELLQNRIRRTKVSAA